jgi:Putative prokaryotic signal transducing protein
MSERSAVVFRTKDPVEGEILVDLLRREGLSARLLGTRNAALLGVAANVFDLKIEVPDEDAEEAAEVIDAYVKGERAPPDERDPAEKDLDDADPADEEPPRRSAIIAGGAALLVPGGGHFYARRIITGLVLVVGYVVAFAALANGHRVESTCGALIIAFLVAADFIGGQRAVRAYNRGARPGVVRELGAGVLLVALAIGAGVLVGTHLPPPKEKRFYNFY